MNRERLELLRQRKVGAAEASFGMREGVKRLREGDSVRMVRISVEFYPKEHWIVEDIDLSRGEIVKGSGRAMTDDIKSRLEEFL